MTSKNVLLLAAVALAGFALGAVLVAGVPIGDDWEPPEPSVESVDIVRSGCHEDVTALGSSSPGNMWKGTVNGTSPHTEVSAEIRLVSPERADITTYRLNVETHNTSAPAPDHDCSADEGAVVYEIEYDTPSDEGADGLRVERFLDGELKGCGGSTSGPDLGCARQHEDVPTHWSNGSVVE